MKKVLLAAVALVALSFSANAQWYVGGNVGFNTGFNTGFSTVAGSNSATVGTFGWQIIPEAGYNINEKIAVGASITLSGNASGIANESNNTFDFRVNPYFRWNFAKVGCVRFLLDSGISLGSTTETNSYSNMGIKNTASASAFAWGISTSPAIAFDITPRLTFVTHVASLGLNGTSFEAGGSFGLNLIAFRGPTIGIFYNL